MKNLKITSVGLLLFNIFIVSAIFFTFYSCSDSDSDVTATTVSLVPYKCVSCKTVPEAKAENDNSYKGIYIGVSSKSSVVVDFQNTGERIYSVVTFDGAKIYLFAKNIFSDENIYAATFSGYFGNQLVMFNFSVNRNGNKPKITSDSFFESFFISKETSNAMIEVFEGVLYEQRAGESKGSVDTAEDSGNNRYNISTVTGKFNMIVSRSQNNSKSWWRGVSILDEEPRFYNGTINSSNELIDEENHLIGTMRVDEIRGVFINELNISVYLSSKRTL
jgi:hypothetical protein